MNRENFGKKIFFLMLVATALIVTWAKWPRHDGGLCRVVTVRLGTGPGWTPSSPEPPRGNFHSPYTAVLMDDKANILFRGPADKSGEARLRDVPAGHYRLDLLVLEKDRLGVGSPKEVDIVAGDLVDISITQAATPSAALFGGEFARNWYGWSMPRVVLPAGITPRAGLDLSQFRVVAVPEARDLNLWRFEMPVQGQADVPRIATRYSMTLKNRDDALAVWTQFLTPGSTAIALPAETAVVRALTDPPKAVAAAPRVTASVATGARVTIKPQPAPPKPDASAMVAHRTQRHYDPLPTDAGTFIAKLQPLVEGDRWEALDEMAEQLREDAKGHPTAVYGLDLFHRLLAGTGGGFEAVIAKHKKWAEAMPHSITPQVQLIEDYIDWAWEARGSGFADTVTESGWDQFNVHIKGGQ